MGKLSQASGFVLSKAGEARCEHAGTNRYMRAAALANIHKTARRAAASYGCTLADLLDLKTRPNWQPRDLDKKQLRKVKAQVTLRISAITLHMELQRNNGWLDVQLVHRKLRSRLAVVDKARRSSLFPSAGDSDPSG